MVQRQDDRGAGQEDAEAEAAGTSAGASTPGRRPLFDAAQMGPAPSWAQPSGAERVVPVTPIDDHTAALPNLAAPHVAAPGTRVTADMFEHTSDIPPIPREVPEELRERRAVVDTTLPVDAGRLADADARMQPEYVDANEAPTIALAVGAAPVAPVPPGPPTDEATYSVTPAPATLGAAAADAGPAFSPVNASMDETVTLDLDEVRVPVVEERLRVETHPVVRGELLVDRRVEERVETVAVDVQREALRLTRRHVEPRLASEADAPFAERSLTIPVFGEHAQGRKQTMITGELVVHRRVEHERHAFQAELRREVVRVEEDYDAVRAAFEEDFTRRREQADADAVAEDRSFAEAEPNYRRGYEAAREPRFAGRDFAQVEADLRQEYEQTANTAATSRAAVAGPEPAVGTNVAAAPASRWRQVLDEVRQGWSRARMSAQERQQGPNP